MTKIAKSWAHSSRDPCFRSIPEPELPTTETSEEKVNAAVKVVKKLKIKNCNMLEQFENPDLQGHYRMIESLALGKDLWRNGRNTQLTRLPYIFTETQYKWGVTWVSPLLSLVPPDTPCLYITLFEILWSAPSISKRSPCVLLYANIPCKL